MAQVPKVYAPTPAQTTAASRTAPSVRVASLDGHVGEAGQGTPTSNLDMAPFTLEDEQQRQPARDQRRNQPPSRHADLLVVPSRSFSSLVEFYSDQAVGNAGPEMRARRIGGIISQAIKTYETNAKIIYGQPEVTGTEISLTL